MELDPYGKAFARFIGYGIATSIGMIVLALTLLALKSVVALLIGGAPW